LYSIWLRRELITSKLVFVIGILGKKIGSGRTLGKKQASGCSQSYAGSSHELLYVSLFAWVFGKWREFKKN